MKRTKSFPFSLRFIDHVAIRVRNLKQAAEWYGQVLGMQPYSFEEWGPVPVFMMRGRFGVALFPAEADRLPGQVKRIVKIDHFAFNVDRENFQKAREHYENLGLDYTIQDHTFFHSIYTKDPDGNTVELTTLVVPENTFYQD